MKFYLIELTTYVDGTADAKAIYGAYDKTEALANFHSKMGGAMKNANYATELLTVIDENGGIYANEKFEREILVEEEPTVEG